MINAAVRNSIRGSGRQAYPHQVARALPRAGLLLYLGRPNLEAADVPIGDDMFLLPADADIRASTGWVSGTVNLFYDAAGDPVAVLASEIAAWPSINQWNVLFHLVSADTETGRLAIYAQDTPLAILNKALQVLRETALDLTPTIFFNGLDTTGKTSYTGGPTYVQDNLGVIRTPAANYPAVEGMRLDGTTYKDTLIDGVTPIVPSVDQPTRTFDAGFTTSSAGPTFKDYTRPTPLTAPGWLCEPAMTNYFTYSDQFDNAIWGKTRSSITANAIAFIDGTLIADKLVEDTTAANSHIIGRSGYLSSASATVVGSVYLKAGERTYAQLRLTDNAANVNSGLNAVSICADLASGVISSTTVLVGNPTNIGYGIDSLGNGWYRVWVRLTKKGDAVRTDFQVFLNTVPVPSANPGYTGDGVSGIYMCGAQMEEGKFPTSRIPTTTTAITRAGTVLTYPTAGKIRSNNIALKLSVVPRGTGQSGYLWGSYTDASNFCYLSINPYDITFKSVVAGISKDVAIASYTHTQDVPFEVILCKSTQGSQLLVREYTGGAWQAWVKGGLSVTGDNLVLSTSYTLGSFNNTSQFTGNISKIDSLLIPSGIANPTAWVESQWDVNGAGSNPVIFNHTFTGLTLLDGVLRTKSATDSVTINWGDGTSNTYAGTADTAFTHTYASDTTIYNVTYTASDSTVLTKIYYNDRAGGKVGGALSLPASMTSFGCYGQNTLSGALSLPASMTSFGCYGQNTLSGALSLPAAMTTFICGGYNTLSGVLSLPASMTSFVCQGQNTLSGVLSLPASMTYFYCTGSNTLSGVLSLPASMTNFTCTGSSTLSGYTPSAKAINQQRFTLTGLNTLSAANVDAIIQDYANAGGTWSGEKIFSLTVLTASNRTAASDAAWTTLGTKGLVTRTITLR